MSWRGWMATVAGLLLLGLLALLWRADAALMRERQLRHAARAREAFAAMERELTRFLEQEEQRPLEHYRYFHVPGGLVSGSVALSRSPLAPFPPPAPISCYLRIEADGSLHSPHQPDDPELARLHGWTADPQLDTRLALLREQLDDGAPPRHDAPGGAAAEPDTVLAEEVVDDESVEGARDGMPVAIADKPAPRAEQLQQEAQSSWSKQSKNMSGRSARKSVEQEIQAQSLANYQDGNTNLNAQLRLNALDDVYDNDPSPSAVQREVVAKLDVDADAELRVRIDPMNGRALANGDLLLLRTVRLRGAEHQQGFVLDRSALQTHLLEQLAVDPELQAVARAGWQPSRPGADYTFEHRFEEPFEDLRLTLSLPALPSLTGSERLWLWGLGAVLALLGLVGVGAIERMVELRLAFAKRRQNFVAAVSHELKTPLTAIRMYAEMLGDGMVPSDEKKQEYYRTIRGESERLSRMIGNVLELGKLERGAVDVQLHCGALAPVLENLRSLLSPHLQEQGFTLEIDCPADLPPALYDRELLMQVLVNCCDNSLKFAAAADDRRIRIEARQLQEGIALRLRDFGPGVAPEHLPKIFESFYRGEDEQTRRHKGSGIGLALVRGLVESMRGRVQAGNHPEGGFQLEFQLVCG